MKNNNANPADLNRACTAAVSSSQAATSGDDTAQNRTPSCSGENLTTQPHGQPATPKPNSAASTPSNDLFRFVSGKTKQNRQPRPCAWCKQKFTPRKTGRIPKFCSSYCRGKAHEARVIPQ